MNWIRNNGRCWCYVLYAFTHILTILNNAPYSPGKIIYLQCCPASHNCENYFYQLKIAKIKTVFPFQDLCVFSVTQPSGSVCDLIIQASKIIHPRGTHVSLAFSINLAWICWFDFIYLCRYSHMKEIILLSF